MANLFAEDSDLSGEENSLRTNNEYAKNYNNWRQKEEFNKLKTKYGESDESEDSSSDDDDNVVISKKLEVDFFKTLSSLKTKDPKIYDENVKFFDNTPIDIKTKKTAKIERMYLKDYERKLLIEKGGILSDSENEIALNNSPTYVEEQLILKQNLHNKVSEHIDDNNDESDWGGMFKKRSKTKEQNDREESEYKQWLTGDIQHLNDLNTEQTLKPLKDYWNNPNLDKSEQFLRDYILNDRFTEKTDIKYVPTYDEIIHDSDNNLSEDESNLIKQEQFEHKYNYRFEEPDQEFVKRYPRTMENSVRRSDDRRKIKRAVIKERKIREKEEKFQEINKMKEFKRMEIQERMEKLRKVTGNTTVAFEDIDLEADFDAEEHDRKMQLLFNNEFYRGEEADQKPEFPEIDEELEIERWDTLEHCEDDNFNMDCENQPGKSEGNDLLDDSTGGRKKRKRKSKLATAISQPKPIFDAKSQTFDEYLDEYYRIDCEDFIGDISCRFKYRKVVPNDFGLTVDEILQAKDRELNKWCSIKKAVQLRPDHVEKYDVIAYSKKSANEALKMKILPSLFEEIVKNEKISRENVAKSNKNGRKTKKSVNKNDLKQNLKISGDDALNKSEFGKNIGKKQKEFCKSVDKNIKSGSDLAISDARLKAFGIKPKKFKNKRKFRTN